MKNYLKGVLFLVIIGSVILGCERDDSHTVKIEEGSDITKTYQAQGKSINFGPQLFGVTYEFTNLTEYQITAPDWHSEQIGSAVVEQSDLNDIASTINSSFNSSLVGLDNFAFCFYMENSFGTNNVTNSNVTGISVISLNSSNKIEHRYLKVTSSGALTEDLGFKSEFEEITLNDLTVLMFESNEGRLENASYFYVNSEDYHELEESKFTEIALSKIVIDNSDYLPTANGASSANCSICDSGNDYVCKSKGGDASSWSCPRPQDEICPTESLAEVGASDPTFDPEISIPASVAYSFRDNILVNSATGIKYIHYYRQLGDIVDIYGTLNTSNFTTHLDFALDMFSIANRMMDQTNNAIVVDTEIKNSAINFIADYRLVTPNAEYHAILDDIELHIIHLHGLTRSEIEYELNN